MHDAKRNDTRRPAVLWHLLNAAACVGLWLLAMASGVAAVVALSPGGLRQSKLMAPVPFLLTIALNFGAAFLASMRAAKKPLRATSMRDA